MPGKRETEQTQKTEKGYEIPVPTKRGFLDALRKVSRKRAGGSREEPVKVPISVVRGFGAPK